MRITYTLNDSLSRDLSYDYAISHDVSIFLASSKGHYLALPAIPTQQISSYMGWFSLIDTQDGYSLYKTIENIYLDQNNSANEHPANESLEIVNRFTSIERKTLGSSETFSIVKNGMIYDAYGDRYVNIDLDFRPIHDYDDRGRIYKIYNESLMKTTDKTIVIEYTKYEDNNLSKVSKKHFMLIHGADGFELRNTWEKKRYQYDETRGTRNEFYVYNSIKIRCDQAIRLIFVAANTKESAIEKLIDIIGNMALIQRVHQHYSTKVLAHSYKLSELAGNEIGYAYVSSLNALESMSENLNVNGRNIRGLWAGLPWFFQFWSRDEMLSTASLVLTKKYDFAKEIIFRKLEEIGKDGRIPNIYPTAGLGSSDGIGWLFNRTAYYINYAKQSKSLGEYFSLLELQYIRDKLKYAIKQTMKNYFRDGLVENGPLETWMDTSFRDSGYETDIREGFRIEIQTLFLGMLHLINDLDDMFTNRFVKKSDKLISVSDSDEYKRLEEDMRTRVRECFLSSKNESGKLRTMLLDGYRSSYSDVIRPNIFLAYYAYPQLLSDTEWESAFDYALEKLWCDWNIQGNVSGGLSTIDRSNLLYQGTYTGQNNKSYHRGDSWFFVNNIAAICMHRLNEKKYSQFIDKILNSSTEDILFSGFVGFASELSSSASYSPGGCLCQTWSIATYIELVHEIFM